MLRTLLIIAVCVILVVVGILIFLGRGSLEETPVDFGQNRLGEDVRIETVRLYFGDRDRFALRPEDRSIVRGPNLNARLAACIQELASGPMTPATPVIPAATRLRRVFVDPWGLAFLDFSKDLLGQRRMRDGEEWLAVASLVRTVCDNYPEIREVRFMVEGQVVTSLAGYTDLEEALRPDDFPLTAPAEAIR